MLTATPTLIPDVVLLEPRVFSDPRGAFFESFRVDTFERVVGPNHGTFVQDNQSRSVKHVLRGLHYQIHQPQGKLVRVLRGEIFDVAVDIRRASPTFGSWVSTTLSEGNNRQLWIPQGFAHGFLVLSDVADVLYKATDYYAPQHERTLLWNDPELNISWPLDGEPIVSAKDAVGSLLKDAEVFDGVPAPQS